MPPRRSKSVDHPPRPPMAFPTVGVSVRVRPLDSRPVHSTIPFCKGELGDVEVDVVHEDFATQDDVYQETFRPIVNSFLQGMDCTVLMYGGSQTGKSYTLEGVGGNKSSEGCIPKAVAAVLQHLAIVPKDQYELSVTYSALTIGHEALLVDLLAPGTAAQSFRESSPPTALSRLTDYIVRCPSDIYEVIRKGRITRAMGLSTCSCSDSRLSSNLEQGSVHTMLTLQLVNREHCKAGVKKVASHIGRITFVELAAPETKDLTDCVADGRDTRSLAVAFSALTGVVLGLVRLATFSPRCTDIRSVSHVPWRDSPLTRWLRETLGSSSLIWVVATLSAHPYDAHDSMATLNFVQRLRHPGKNGVLVSAVWEERCPICWAASQRDCFDTANSPYDSATVHSTCTCSSLGEIQKKHTNHVPRLTFIPKNNLAVAMLSGGHTAIGADAATHNELMAIIKRSGVGCRAEILLANLMQEVSELRGVVAAEKSESKLLKTNLQMLASEKQLEEQEREVKRQTVAALREQLVHTQVSLDEARSRREETQRESSERQIRICELDRENKILRSAKEDLSHKLNVEIQELNNETQRLRAKCLDASKKAQTERSIRKNHESEMKKLEEKLCDHQRLQDECQGLKKTLENVRQERAKVQDAKWIVDEKAERLAADLEAARLALSQSESTAQMLRTRCQNLEDDIHAARSHNDTLRKSISACEMQLDAQKQIGKAYEILQSDFDEIKSLMDEMEGHAARHRCLHDVENPLQECEHESGYSHDGDIHSNSIPIVKWRNVLSSIIHCLDATKSDNHDKQSNYEELLQSLSKSEKANEQLSSDHKVLEDQLCVAESLCDSMRNDLESLHESEKAAAIMISRKEDRIGALQAEQTSLSEEARLQSERVKILTEQVEELKVTNSDFVTSEDHHKRVNSNLTNELETLQKQLERSQQQHQEDHQKLLRLQHELRLVEEADEDKRVQLSAQREERARLEEDNRSKREAVTNLRRGKSDVESELEDSSRKLERLETKLRATESQAKLTSEKLERMAAEAAREEAHLRSDIEILRSQKEELEIRLAEIAKESSGLRLTVEELEDERQKIKKLLHEESANRDTISFLQEKLSACATERDQSQAQSNTLKEEVKSLTISNTSIAHENHDLGETVISLKKQLEQARLDSVVMAAKQARTQESLRHQRRESQIHQAVTPRAASLMIHGRSTLSSDLLPLSARKWSAQVSQAPFEWIRPQRSVSDMTSVSQAQKLSKQEGYGMIDTLPTLSNVSSTATEVLAEIGETLGS